MWKYLVGLNLRTSKVNRIPFLSGNLSLDLSLAPIARVIAIAHRISELFVDRSKNNAPV
jgi:hypothetical protein